MMYRQTLRLFASSIVCLNVAGGVLFASTTAIQETTNIVALGRLAGKGGVLLAFRALVQGIAPGGTDARPSLHLVRTNAQRAVLVARLSAVDRSVLDTVDLVTSVVIAAFQGLQPTSGYRIDILTVEAHGNVLEVTVKRSTPAPGEPVRHGFESPYHLVQVAQETFNAYHFASYRLRDTQGEVLQEELLDTVDWGQTLKS